MAVGRSTSLKFLPDVLRWWEKRFSQHAISVYNMYSLWIGGAFHICWPEACTGILVIAR